MLSVEIFISASYIKSMEQKSDTSPVAKSDKRENQRGLPFQFTRVVNGSEVTFNTLIHFLPTPEDEQFLTEEERQIKEEELERLKPEHRRVIFGEDRFFARRTDTGEIIELQQKERAGVNGNINKTPGFPLERSLRKHYAIRERKEREGIKSRPKK